MRHDAWYARHVSTRRSTAVKRILTDGLVATAAAVPPALARAPWWAVVLLMLLVLLTASLVHLVSLRMTIEMAKWLVERSYPGSFKGPWNIELKGPSESAEPTPEPGKPKRWLRRKPPPDS
jgi:hypothetical protein